LSLKTIENSNVFVQKSDYFSKVNFFFFPREKLIKVIEQEYIGEKNSFKEETSLLIY
jgi:hypothetical protein